MAWWNNALREVGKVAEQAVQKAGESAQKAGEFVQGATVAECDFINDTEFYVSIVDHVGTRTLAPYQRQNHYQLVKGFSIDLILHLPNNEKTHNFHTNAFQNRAHDISYIFKQQLDDYEQAERTKVANHNVQVKSSSSKWFLVHHHPGGFVDENVRTTRVKNTWSEKVEKGMDFGVDVKTVIKAVEISPSFKMHTKLTRVDECETELTSTKKTTFTDACMLWQEIVVLDTDLQYPLDTLEIPTKHFARTKNEEESKPQFLCTK